MVRRESRLTAIMFAFLFGFATIRAEEIPEGVMPKRQVQGTGVTSSTVPDPTPSSTTVVDPPTPSSTTVPDPPTPSSTTANDPDPVTSDTPNPDPSTTAGDDDNDTTTNNGDDTTTQSQVEPPSSTSIPTTVEVTTTNDNGETVTSRISTNTLAPVTTNTAKATTAITSTNSNGDNIVKVGTKTVNPSTLEHKTTVRQPLVAQETRHSTYTSVWTSNGEVYSSVYTTDIVFASTTGYATATIAPGLANGGGSGDNLSTNAKKIIGGVVGGIGGAILIGGLAFVAWRLWGKKKAAAGEQDDFYDGSQEGSIANQKRESMGVLSNSGASEGGGNGLERYQNPNGRINTASNF